MLGFAIWYLAFASVHAQFCPPGKLDLTNYVDFCNETFASVNGTGFYSFSPSHLASLTTAETHSFPAGVPNVTWAITQEFGDTRTSTYFWFNTGGLNYTNDLKLNYDVCYLGIVGLTPQAQYAGQDDDGSCSSTLSSACINALTDQASQLAAELTDNPTFGPSSNLTGDVVGVCNQIGNTMQDNFPSECTSFFTTSQAVLQGRIPFTEEALTDYNGTNPNNTCVDNIPNGCKVTDPARGTFWAVDGFYRTAANLNESQRNYLYDDQSWVIYPSLLTWLPAATYQRTIDYGTVSQLSCLRPNQWKAGSRVPLPMPRPSETSSGLSKGDIAGIVVGSVVGGLLVAAAIGWLIWRRRRRSRAAGTKMAEMDGSEEGKRKEMGSHDIMEVGGGVPGELSEDAQKKQELPSPEYELPGSEPPGEMYAEFSELPANTLEPRRSKEDAVTS